ncbi:hypothetical protein AKO1_003335 [Acrasis kona]|uniref:Uncharacterized protein n=1 Tax=Acrasis kona TaxID=1008807 RepID=A0AAW2Z792_9EUKA
MSMGLSKVGVCLVRNVGGDDSMNNIKEDLNSVKKSCVNHIIKNEPKLKKNKSRSLLKKEIKKEFNVTITDYKNKKFVYNFGDLHGAIVLLGRQNKATLDKQFLEVSKNDNPNLIEALNKHDHDSGEIEGGMCRFFVVTDECDEMAASSNRDKNLTEKNFMHTGIVGHRRSLDNCANASDSSDSETDSEPDEYQQTNPDKRDISFQDFIECGSMHEKSYCLVGVSATWHPSVLVNPDSKIKQRVNVIDLPVSKNYVGFSTEKNQLNTRSVIIEEVNECRDLKESKDVYDAHSGALDKIIQSLVERYNSNNIDEVNIKSPQNHISLLINTRIIQNSNTVQLELAEALRNKLDSWDCSNVDDLKEGVPAVVFVYNQTPESGSLYLTDELCSILEEKGEKIDDILKKIARNVTTDINTDQNSNDVEIKFNFNEDIQIINIESKPSKLRKLVSTVYDCAYALFSECEINPFVVCITGRMGGRGLRLKDSKHRYVLTDQYIESGRKWTMAYLIQASGRITSKDKSKAERRLWCPKDTRELLELAIDFEMEMRKLYQLDNQGRGLELIEALKKMNITDHKNVIDGFLWFNENVASKHLCGPIRAYTDRFCLKAKNVGKDDVYIDRLINKRKTPQWEALLLHMKSLEYNSNGWTAKELKEGLKNKNLLLHLSSDEIDRGEYSDNAYVIKIGKKKDATDSIFTALNVLKKNKKVKVNSAREKKYKHWMLV